MKPALFLRIASVLTFVHAVLHTIGGVLSKPDPGPAAVAFAAMQSNQFVVMGLVRSYAVFYLGMGLAGTIFFTAEGVLFWQLGSLARNHAHALRPIFATFLIAYFALAFNSCVNFFLPPVIFEILIACCLTLAMVTSKEPRTA
jgi:hypothetical protein